MEELVQGSRESRCEHPTWPGPVPSWAAQPRRQALEVPRSGPERVSEDHPGTQGSLGPLPDLFTVCPTAPWSRPPLTFVPQGTGQVRREPGTEAGLGMGPPGLCLPPGPPSVAEPWVRPSSGPTTDSEATPATLPEPCGSPSQLPHWRQKRGLSLLDPGIGPRPAHSETWAALNLPVPEEDQRAHSPWDQGKRGPGAGSPPQGLPSLRSTQGPLWECKRWPGATQCRRPLWSPPGSERAWPQPLSWAPRGRAALRASSDVPLGPKTWWTESP